METRLKIENLSYSYGSEQAVSGVSLHVNRGEFVGLIGPNGCGKSTLLKNIYRVLTPDAGSMELDGENLLKMKRRESARRMAVVCQENETPFHFTVEEIVAMGRTPHKGMFETDNGEDKKIVRHALEHVGMQHLAGRSYQSLSGGEKQRVMIARAVAQDCDLMILDEPTNHLDVSYQLQVFDFIRRLKVTALAAVHDLNLAALYCDRIYVMKRGKIVLEGAPEEVLTPENIWNVYGVRSTVLENPTNGKRIISFLPA